MENSTNTRFLSTTEVANLLGISRVAVLKRIQAGTLKAAKVGRNYVIAESDILESARGDRTLSEERKALIEEAVRRAVHDYGETFKLLGRE